MKNRVWQNLFPYLIIIISSIAIIFQWSSGHNWGDDFAAYILQAISIADGEVPQFVSKNYFTIHHSSYAVGPVTYPWGFPLLLSPVYIVFGLNIIAFKALCLVCFILFLLTLALGFKKFLDHKEIIIFIALFGFNLEFINFSDNVLSDLPFLFFSTLAILLMSGVSKLKTKKVSLIIFCGIGISITCAVMIRTNGLLLLLTYIVILLIGATTNQFSKLQPYFFNPFEDLKSFSNFFRWMCPSIPIFMVLFVVLLANQILPDKQASHLDFLSGVSINSIIDNARYYAWLPRSFFSHEVNFGKLIYVVTIPFVLIGIRNQWKNTTVFIIYIIFTLAMYFAWPPRQGLRFLYPVMPFYIFYFLIGLRILPNISKHIKSSIILPTLIIAIALIPQTVIAIKHSAAWRDIEGPFTVPSQEMFRFISENTSEEEVIVFFKPRAMRLFTKRDSLVYSKPEDFIHRRVYVHSKDHSPLTKDQLVKLSSLYTLTQIFENEKFIVYRFKDG